MEDEGWAAGSAELKVIVDGVIIKMGVWIVTMGVEQTGWAVWRKPGGA